MRSTSDALSLVFSLERAHVKINDGLLPVGSAYCIYSACHAKSSISMRQGKEAPRPFIGRLPPPYTDGVRDFTGTAV